MTTTDTGDSSGATSDHERQEILLEQRRHDNRYWRVEWIHKRQILERQPLEPLERQPPGSNKIQEPQARTDRYWSHERQILEPRTTDSYWSHKRQILEPQDETTDTEPQTTATTTGAPQTTAQGDTGATNDRYWSHKRSTDTGWSHKRHSSTTGAKDNRRDTGATCDQ